jgi:hypothetical protein
MQEICRKKFRNRKNAETATAETRKICRKLKLKNMQEICRKRKRLRKPSTEKDAEN